MAWQTQVSTWTTSNRYPGIFRTVQSRIRQKAGTDLGQKQLRILSFGCSNGSELASLRSYFPEAVLFGCDVNPKALRDASDLLANDDAVLFESTPESVMQHGPYDVIFAMSILCRFPESRENGLQDLTPIYRFDKFEENIDTLVESLKEDGILCLYNSNYKFQDCRIAGEFSTITSPWISDNGFVDKFARDGRRLTQCQQMGTYYAHDLVPMRYGDSPDFVGCIFERHLHGTLAIGQSSPDQLSSVPALPPDYVLFGPDLTYCAGRRLVSHALGCWVKTAGPDSTLTRAWFRSTPGGSIKVGERWTVRCDSATHAILSERQFSPLPKSSDRASEQLRGRITQVVLNKILRRRRDLPLPEHF